MNTEASIAEFETYVNHFLDNAPYEFTYFIEYPEFGNYGKNVLFEGESNFAFGRYSLAANLPEGTELKIIIHGNEIGEWGFPLSAKTSWNRNLYDQNTHSQLLTAESGKENELEIILSVPVSYWSDSTNMVDGKFIDPPRNTFTIEYFENNSEDPTRTKSIYLEGYQ